MNESLTPAAENSRRLIEIPSERGPISCALHLPSNPATEAVVIMVGGGDGGLEGPSALYPDLADDLCHIGIGALRLDFRDHRFPGIVEAGVHDVRAGLDYLTSEGVQRVGLLGHSFGGAVMIEAAVQTKGRAPRVAAVATLATQTAGAQRVGLLAPIATLFVHGLADQRLPADCSRLLYERAGDPRRIELFAGATHSLRQAREEVRGLVVEWFGEQLGAASGSVQSTTS